VNQHHQHLLQLTYIRSLLLFVLCAMIVFAVMVLHLHPNITMTGLSLSALFAVNLMTGLRLHSNWPVLHPEFFSQLCADAILYSSLLYQFGGATNPFISILLIPLIITASTLPLLYTLAMSLFVSGLYTSLLYHHVSLVELSARHQHSVIQLFDLHITGMWLSFILSVALISVFIVRMQRSLRQGEHKLQQAREKSIQDQQLLALATMAAGTAHELGTPLSTLRIVLKDLELDHPELKDDIELMQQQVDLCASRLKALTQSIANNEDTPQPITQFMNELLSTWQLQRPHAAFDFSPPDKDPIPWVNSNVSLRQALLNLLNNAADASAAPIHLALDWDTRSIWLKIQDQGPGLTPEQMQTLGKPFVTTKGGLGIGLFLTTSTLASQKGDVRLYNHPQGGTLTEVRLAIHPIKKA